ncbi:hypothetical protein Hanom_Chr06g00574121 [Helianthus anomalus]
MKLYIFRDEKFNKVCEGTETTCYLMSGCNPSQVRNICNGTHLESFVNQTVVDEHVRHSKHRDPQPLQFHHHHISLFFFYFFLFFFILFYFILFVFSYSYVVITHLSVLIRRKKPYLREQSRMNKRIVFKQPGV